MQGRVKQLIDDLFAWYTYALCDCFGATADECMRSLRGGVVSFDMEARLEALIKFLQDKGVDPEALIEKLLGEGCIQDSRTVACSSDDQVDDASLERWVKEYFACERIDGEQLVSIVLAIRRAERPGSLVVRPFHELHAYISGFDADTSHHVRMASQLVYLIDSAASLFVLGRPVGEYGLPNFETVHRQSIIERLSSPQKQSWDLLMSRLADVGLDAAGTINARMALLVHYGGPAELCERERVSMDDLETYLETCCRMSGVSVEEAQVLLKAARLFGSPASPLVLLGDMAEPCRNKRRKQDMSCK